MKEVKGFRECDIIVRYVDHTKCPQRDITLRRGRKTVPMMSIIACAVSDKVSMATALAHLGGYLKEENPLLDDSDFRLELGWDDHVMSGVIKRTQVIFVSASGCHIGRP